VPRVAVLGASGYAGAVAAMLVHRHPFFELAHVTARSEAGARLDDIHPRTRVPLELEPWDPDVQSDVDAALVCWPHRVAAPAVAALRERGVRVVDLSADFRLSDQGIYEDWYGPHGAPALFGQGVYGLPELHRDAIAGADLVANPGCYPTATLLALAPLARAGLIADVVVDAKSGVSGAGRAPTQTTHFVSANENVTPYGVGRHRHIAEIEQELRALGATEAVVPAFTPHLLPLDQGELVSCYVTTTRPVDPDAVAELYAQDYDEEPFVELAERPPGVRDVRASNVCRMHVHVDARTGKVFVFATLDNLWKGASSQAVQNLNLMFGLDERAGLS
jgi:N-acetyl-gamma-glutamyl-phosphate reductase